MKQPTKADLELENAQLKAELNNMEAADEKARKEISQMLGAYQYVEGDTGGFSRFPEKKKENKICSWLEIAFLIGELKADADYSCAIEARERLKRELDDAHEHIRKLTNPEPKDGCSPDSPHLCH